MREKLTKTFKAFTYREVPVQRADVDAGRRESWLILDDLGQGVCISPGRRSSRTRRSSSSAVGGVLADRMDRRRILLLSQVVQLTSAFLLAWLVYTNRIEVWMILVLSLRRRSRDVVWRARVPGPRPDARRQGGPADAVALNSIQFNLARVIVLRDSRSTNSARRLRPQRALLLRGHRRAPRAPARRADRHGERKRPREPEGRAHGRPRRPVAPPGYGVASKPLRVSAPNSLPRLREGRLQGRREGPELSRVLGLGAVCGAGT